MISFIENWLIVGLAINWIGLMFQRYHPSHRNKPVDCPWWYEIIGIIFWPFAFALGFVMSRIEYNKRKKKK